VSLLAVETGNRTMGESGSSLAKWLKQRLKMRLKPIYASGQRLAARALFPYSAAQLASAIRALDIGAGDAVMVHSGFRRVSGFTGTPGDVIECLLEVVGPDGHLLMMSIPYRGASQRYAERDPLFDVRRTPSAVGVISEIFRRRPDVRRSLSPFHPVLAHGPLAAWLVADHDKCLWSCGKGSPFERFLQLDGVFLFYDASYTSLTFMHYVEDCFRERLPVPLYGPEGAVLRVTDVSGRETTVRHAFFSEAARARRNFSAIEHVLLREGALRTARIGNTRLLSVRARSVLDVARRLVDQGTGFYR
jgi:aminoglycoside 3-N-acetyltransferase